MEESSESEGENASPFTTPLHRENRLSIRSIRLSATLDPDDLSDADSRPQSPRHSGVPEHLDLKLLSTNLLKHKLSSSEHLRTSSEYLIADSLVSSASDLDIVVALESTPLEAKQLYLAVARCIAYPFNAKFQVS